jgi:hypothetical protein
MSKSLFPRTEVEETPARTRKVTAPLPRWVLVTLAILLLGVVVFAILHFTGSGHGMGNMQMSIPEPGRYAR